MVPETTDALRGKDGASLSPHALGHQGALRRVEWRPTSNNICASVARKGYSIEQRRNLDRYSAKTSVLHSADSNEPARKGPSGLSALWSIEHRKESFTQ